MPNVVRFWVDPICPWCWVTARWVREVAPERDLVIVWEPISLFFKNEPAVDSQGYEPTRWSLVGYGYLERAELQDELRKPAELAHSLAVHVERLRVCSPHPVDALLELVAERSPGLLDFGPELTGYLTTTGNVST